MALKNLDLSDDKSPRVMVAMVLGLSLLTLLGGVLRFWRLGTLGLIVDEGYQVLAVQGILDHGLPQLDSGLLYTRSFLFLYLQAFCAWLFGLSEWSMRLPAAVFGVATIPLAYWFGRSLMGVRAGWLLAVLFAFSAWEIEYARYARFYTLFQGLYMVGLVAWFRGFVQMEKPWRWMFGVVFVLACITHPLGVMLGMSFLLVIPLKGYTSRRKWAYVFLAGGCGGFWVLYNKVYGLLTDALSQTVIESAGKDGMAVVDQPAATAIGQLFQKLQAMLPGLKLPEFEFVQLVWAEHHAVMLGVLAVYGVLGVVLGWWVLRPCEATVSRMTLRWKLLRTVLLVLIAWTGAVHMVALAVVLAVLYLAFFVRRASELLRGEVVLAVLGAWVGMAGWTLWFRLSDDASLTAGLRQMLSFPGLWTYWIQWMLPGWPVMLGLMGLGFVVLARRAVSEDGRMNSAWFILGATMVPMVVTAQLQWKFSESRYFLHLYPLMLLWVVVLVVALGDVARRWWPAMGCPWRQGLITTVLGGLMLMVGHDADPRHAWAVSMRVYGQYKDPIRSVLNFRWHAEFHQDLKTASLATRPEIAPDDVVVVVGPPHQATVYRHYLGAVDYIVSSLDPYLSLASDDQGDLVDLVSGGKMISTAAELEAVRSETAGRVWLFSDWPLVADDCWYLSDADPALKQLVAEWMQDPVRVAADGRTTVSRFLGGLKSDDDPQMDDDEPSDTFQQP